VVRPGRRYKKKRRRRKRKTGTKKERENHVPWALKGPEKIFGNEHNIGLGKHGGERKDGKS